jgi:hypothetical protein
MGVTGRSLALSAALSAVVSAVASVCLGLAGTARPEASRGAPRSRSAPAAQEPAAAEKKAASDALSSLKAELAAIRQDEEGRSARLRRAEESRIPDLPSEETPDLARPREASSLDRAVRRLLGVREPGQQIALRKAVEDLLPFGDLAVPALEKGSAADVGPDFPDLRAAIAEVLCRIGTPAATAAALRILEHPKTLAEVEAVLAGLENAPDPRISEGLSATLPSVLAAASRGELGTCEKVPLGFSRNFAKAARDRGLAREADFMDRVKSALEPMDPGEPGFGELLALVLDHSPEQAWQMACDKSRRAGGVSVGEIVVRMGTLSVNDLQLPQFARFVRIALASPLLGERDRRFLYAHCRQVALGRKGADTDRPPLAEIVSLLKDARSREKDPKTQRSLDATILAIEKKLGR